MHKAKVLFIAYTFPPIPYGGSYRALRLCQGFSKKGIECHVLTIREYPDIPNDHNLTKKIPDDIHVHKTSIIDPWRKYQLYKAANKGGLFFKIVNKIVSFALRFITFPDHMLLWIPFAYIKSRQIIKKHGIKKVLVSSPPHSSQIIGWILQKAFKVYWVADLRDPIFGNVAQVQLINPKNIFSKIERNLLLKFDNFITKNANVIVANTNTHAEELLLKFPENNIQTIRNSFNPADFETVKRKTNSKLTIAHIGSIYGKRNPTLLFQAVRHLLDEYEPQTVKLNILFIGSGNNSILSSIEQYSLHDYVELIDQVPHERAIEYMCNSDILLLLKATGEWSKGQIPGKFFEYVGTGNKILCLGASDSEVADLIREDDLGYVIEDKLDELVNILRSEYECFLNNDQNKRRKMRTNINKYSSDIMVNKMYDIIG